MASAASIFDGQGPRSGVGTPRPAIHTAHLGIGTAALAVPYGAPYAARGGAAWRAVR
jgi:hypothetical protein